MRFTIPILWLVLIYAIDIVTAFLSKRVQLPETYTDNTPYKGLDFDSINVTLPLRTQRDIGLNVTIDRWLWPAIDLRSAYFGNDYSAQKLSHVEDIIYMGYRRLVVDIYWDPDRHTWQLCPVKLPSSALSRKSKRSDNKVSPTTTPSSSPLVGAAKKNNHNNSSTSLHRAASSTTGRIVNNLIPISTEDVDIGQYKCAPWYTFQQFLDSVNHYLTATDITTAPSETSLLFLVLNLHQLTSSNNNSNDGAGDNDSLGEIIRSTIVGTDRNTSRLYTPNDLIRNRQNLTASFDPQQREGSTLQEEDSLPIFDPNAGELNSDSAWPTFIYLIQRDIQLLVGFGYNELPTNTNYNHLQQDEDTIFNSTQLGAGWYMNQVNLTDMEVSGWADCSRPSNNTYVLPTSTGNVTSGTSPSEEPMSSDDTILSWSWVYMNDWNNAPFSYNTTLKAVQCGYSPYFTMQNYTDDNSDYSTNDTTHLADNILGTIWSWDIGEPKISSNPHCAMIQRWNGRWRAGDCTELLRVACRHKDDPNKWLLTQTYVSYDRAFSACPDDYVFDCPRIPQQNRMLLNSLAQDFEQNGAKDEDTRNILHHLFWINLNSGNNGSCWVVGLFSTCWWMTDNANVFQKLIRTSAIAGAIVLILVGIFTWIKCARWWRTRKAQIRKNFIKDLLARREYVTVPA
ncbi:hypothetical protein BDA99DRAFT_495024 [Phascolomyces articulosus]|uniref:Maintenance of telomere capping protein 6 n=1 Tax=Phascolomyces articulosus TaxID=60185 RepID=A0AAD5KB82_9FUNG|nr:hypothetical protein BDA99DRAFT_495024 [Phascolomyces articulosus]